MNKLSQIKICIVGLGYVGLPLAVEFGKKRSVIGFDKDNERIQELKNGYDKTNEIPPGEIKEASFLELTSNESDILDCNCYIICVPTPIDQDNQPDISLLISASKIVGEALKKDDIVIYESTVYPGCTEEDCVPQLEFASGFKFNKDFFCGYSPERINPGDKINTLRNILKVTSGSNELVADLVDKLYQEIIEAGTYKAESIKVAEAAKVIENTQRDINVAFMNELSIIFNNLDIDTNAVLKAASTKWNFLSFKPGLVGGHCIGVDPYYLYSKSKEKGHEPRLISTARKINNEMPKRVAKNLLKNLAKKNRTFDTAKVLIMGFTFKENCPDFRNTKIIDLAKELDKENVTVDIYDPIVDINSVNNTYKVSITNDKPKQNFYDAVIIAVSHSSFVEMGLSEIKNFTTNSDGIIYDLKHIFDSSITDLSL